jgi:predicted naringenin-chalcone synthase
MTAVAHINAIGTALPPHEVHNAFQGIVHNWLGQRRERVLFDRMAQRSGIERRFSFLAPDVMPDGTVTDNERFYGPGEWPGTAARMARYEQWAPRLAMQALDTLGGALGSNIAEAGITHLIVASCTGFVAPGLDQLIVAEAGLDPGVERTVVGFMGCYAAVNALRLAHHFVRSEPAARVLVVNVELCTLHFQRTTDLGKLLAMLLFGDGASAALVTAESEGIALTDFRAATIGGSADAITWRIGDQGFDMHLGGQVPHHIGEALGAERERNDDGGLLRGKRPEDYALWAVHAGGRTILDAVEKALDLPGEALAPSREVLRANGNLSSATLMFVLAAMMAAQKDGEAPAKDGMAMAFGPGLAAESFRFTML